MSESKSEIAKAGKASKGGGDMAVKSERPGDLLKTSTFFNPLGLLHFF